MNGPVPVDPLGAPARSGDSPGRFRNIQPYWNVNSNDVISSIAGSGTAGRLRNRKGMRNTIESVEDDAGNVVTYRRHANGGGLVGRGAKVGTTSVIGSATYVEAGARVGSGCRIGSGSWIDRKAHIGDHAVIGDAVYVGPGAVLGNRVRIGSHSRIGARAQIGDGVRLHADSTVPEGGHVSAAVNTPNPPPSASALPGHRRMKRSAA
jgi:tetrahydrodipicolinate N-succinyltransferase